MALRPRLSAPFSRIAAPRSIGTLLLGLCLIAASAQAANWPMFRGNTAQTGVASGKLTAKPQLLWKYKTGRAITCAPAIANGRVYIGSTDGFVYALDAKSGKKIWSFETQDEVEAPPLALGSGVFIGSADRYFYALDAATGKLRWKFKTGDKILGGANWFPGANGIPRLVFGSYDNKLYCVDAKSGKEIWNYETPNYINGTPAIAGRKAIFGGCDGSIHLVSLDSGKAVAEIKSGAYIAGSAALSGNEIYVGNYGNQFMRANAATEKIAWTYKDRNFAYFSSPALWSDRVIVGSRDKRLHCLSRQTGKAIWTFNARGKVDSSPVICDGKVVFGADNGRIYIVDLRSGKELWSYEIGKPVTGSPAVANGTIVIGGEDGFVYAFGAK